MWRPRDAIRHQNTTAGRKSPSLRYYSWGAAVTETCSCSLTCTKAALRHHQLHDERCTHSALNPTLWLLPPLKPLQEVFSADCRNVWLICQSIGLTNRSHQLLRDSERLTCHRPTSAGVCGLQNAALTRRFHNDQLGLVFIGCSFHSGFCSFLIISANRRC